jgi:hypothetical protein
VEEHRLAVRQRLLLAVPASFAIANWKFTIGNRIARVAKLADAPDLGLRNHRFQRVALHFKANAFYEWKTGISYKIVAVANGE